MLPPHLALAAPGDEKKGPAGPATLGDIAISVNGQLVPGVDDPQAILVSNMIKAGKVTPVVLDFLAGQGLRAPTLEAPILFSDPATFNYPVPPSSNFDDVKVVAGKGELIFQIGSTAPSDPAFKPVLEHFVPGVQVAGKQNQFVRTKANLYFVNRNAKGLDSVRVVSIPQAEGTAALAGALFKGTVAVTHAISLAHIPAGWGYQGISLIARNQRPRKLLRFDNFRPVPKSINVGGEDVVLQFHNGEEVVHLWIPQEILNQQQLRRLEQITWLSLLDNGGVDEGEAAGIKAFMESMAEESTAIDQARKDLAALHEKDGDSLTHSDLTQEAVRNALKRFNIPMMVHLLAPVTSRATTHRGEQIELVRSRLATLYNSQRDRFGKTWEADYERITRARATRVERGQAVSDPSATATKAWAAELQEALKADGQVLAGFEATAEMRKAVKSESYIRRALKHRGLQFLSAVLALTGAVALSPDGSPPAELVAAIGSHIVAATENAPAEMVIKPITDFGTMIGKAVYEGEWQTFAALGAGFGLCLSQYFLGHLIAASVATARRKTGEFFTRSTNIMWSLFCKASNPITMGEGQRRWIFNTGRKDRVMEARFEHNTADLEANLQNRLEAKSLAAQLATMIAAAQKKTDAGQGEAPDAMVSEVLADILAASAVGEEAEISPDVLVALATSGGLDAALDAATMTDDQIKQRTEALMTDPQQVDRLVAIRALLVRALTAIADTDPAALPIDGKVVNAKVEFYKKLAAQVKAAKVSPEAKTGLGRAFNGFCKFTSKNLLTFKNFLGEVLLGVKGADMARQSGKPVPEHIKSEVVRRAIIDFIFSEFNGAIMEPATFRLPTSVSGIPGFMPAMVGSWEQTFAWLMIPIGNMMLTMARPQAMKQSASPFESFGLDLTEGEMQSMESYVARMFTNAFDPDPESPGFFKNVFNYIKAGVLQHKVRCGFLGICLLAGFLITKFTGSPEAAAKINLWTIPLVAWISAYNISFAKASVSPWHVGYAMAWPAVDLGDVNNRWAEKNSERIGTALGEIGSMDPELRIRGIRSMKELYHEGYKDLPERFNIDAEKFTEKDAAEFYAHVLTRLPLPTRASKMGSNLLNVAGVTFTTLIYFSVFKGLLGDVPTVAQAGRDFAFTATWMSITAGSALTLDWASRKAAKWFSPVTNLVGAGIDKLRRCADLLMGKQPVNTK